jgi:pSer/pThr/pTyr-binding forkhead associated (FHA) protein
LSAPDDQSVSRIHAHVWHDGHGWWVADLGSTNGTYHNGRLVTRDPVGPLRLADLVQFGQSCLRVESVRAPGPGEVATRLPRQRVRVGPTVWTWSLTEVDAPGGGVRCASLRGA